MHEIIFYNGFNLLVDLIIAGVVGLLAYRSGVHRGFIDGYGAGASDYAGKELPITSRGWTRGD